MRALLLLLVVLLLGVAIWWQAPRSTPVALGPSTSAPSANEAEVAGSTSDELDVAARGDARSTELASDASRAAALEAGTEPERVPELVVVGRVVDEQRRPLANADVHLSAKQGPWRAPDDMDPEPRAGRGRSSADGTFRLAAPHPARGIAFLVVEDGPYREQVASRLSGSEQDLQIISGPHDVGDVVLRAGGAVSGRVVSGGVPIPAASIAATQRAPDLRLQRATATSDGRFLLAGLAPGSADIEVAANGFVTRKRALECIEIERTLEIGDVDLAVATRVSGVIVDTSGVPVAEARVSGKSVVSESRCSATSNESGRFELCLQAAEPHWLAVDTRGRHEPWGRPKAPECTFEPGARDVRIVLAPREPTTFRVVAAADGTPIGRYGIALVEAPRRNTPDNRQIAEPALESHARGEAVLPAFENSQHVRVVSPGYASFGGPVQPDEPGGHVQTIRLRRAGRLHGRVVRADGESARAYVVLEAAFLGAAARVAGATGAPAGDYDLDVFTGRPRRAVCAPDGSFRFANLDAGTFRLTARAEGCVPATLDGLAIVEGGEMDVGEIQLESGGIVRGRLDTGAASRIGWGVALDGGRFVRIAAEDGRFEIDGVVPGPHSIEWSRPGTIGLEPEGHAGAPARSLVFVLATGETKELVLDARRVAQCRVRVSVTVDGAPVEGAAVECLWRAARAEDWNRNQLPNTRADGRTEVEMAGHLEIRCAAFGSFPSTGMNRRLLAWSAASKLVPGGVVDVEVHSETGELVLRFADDFAIPKPGRYSLWLNPTDEPRFESTLVTGYSEDRLHPPAPGDWTSRRVVLGRFAAGEYRAHLDVERTSLDANGHFDSEPVLPALERQITIRAGETTELNVP